jgi:hypothetical protein
MTNDLSGGDAGTRVPGTDPNVPSVRGERAGKPHLFTMRETYTLLYHDILRRESEAVAAAEDLGNCARQVKAILDSMAAPSTGAPDHE